MKEQNLHSSISHIILGTWAMGGNHWGTCDDADALRAIETAIDNGINTIDTAPVYGDGHAEELVGKAIRGKREKIFLATKCGLDIYTNKYLSLIHISEPTRLLSNSYAVFCLKKKKMIHL